MKVFSRRAPHILRGYRHLGTNAQEIDSSRKFPSNGITAGRDPTLDGARTLGISKNIDKVGRGNVFQNRFAPRRETCNVGKISAPTLRFMIDREVFLHHSPER
jgi:hypothetical protein